MKINSVINIKVDEPKELKGFNPDDLSVIFAINSESLERDLEIIKTFSNAPIALLKGVWEGESERSYQVTTNNLNYDNFFEAMTTHRQECFIYLGLNRTTWLADVADNSINNIGTMQEVAEPTGNYTYCETTNKYWRAS